MTWQRFLLIFSITIFIAAEGILFRFTADDSYITYRYVQNIAAGSGAVYNPGVRVEGYSNPVWMAIHVPFKWIGLSLELVSKILGILSALGLAFLTVKITNLHISLHNNHLSSFLVLYVLSNMSILYYSISGMETVFYSMLIMALLWFMDTRQWLKADVVVGVIALTRPEGILLLVPYALGLFRGKKFSKASLYVFLPLIVVAAYFLFRQSYFEKPFPNTFYAKIVADRTFYEMLVKNTEVFVPQFLNWSLKNMGLGSLSVLAVFGIFKIWKKHLPLLSTVLVLFFFIWYSGGDWMAFNRFYVPVFAPLLVFSIIGIDQLVLQFRRNNRVKVLISIFISCLILLNFTHSAFCTYQLIHGDRYNHAMTSCIHCQVGKFLKDYADPSDIIVTNEIGAIGYYSGLKTIDTIGLIDEKIPSLKQEPELDNYVKYIFSYDPEFIMVNIESRYGDQLMHPHQRAIYDEMLARGNYKLLREYDLTNDKKWLLFERIN